MIAPSPTHQRLPCVALLFAAITGAAAGRFVEIPGTIFLVLALAALAASLVERLRGSIWLGVALAFAALQSWQFRESPAAALSSRLTDAWQVCEAEVTVADAPEKMFEGFRFEGVVSRLTVGGKPLPANCRISVRWLAPEPAYGSLYRVRAAIRNLLPPRNPGEPDYAAILANDGMRSELMILRESDATLLRRGGNPIVSFAIASRNYIERTLSLGISGTEEAALLLGMTVGDTSGIDETLRDAFRKTGTYHLFSVSGLHVSIVAVILWFVLGLTGIDRRRVILILIPCLFFYALLTGLKPASIRAATMLSILAAGLAFDRLPIALNSLGAAGLVILLANTNQLFNPGFQMSFTVVAAILLVALPLASRLAPLFEPDPFLPRRLLPPLERGLRGLGRWASALFALSLAAWLGSIPFMLAYFHLFSFVAIPANFLIVPLAFVTIATAALSLVTSLFSTWLAAIFNNTAFLICHVILSLVTGFSEIPGGSLYVGKPLPSGRVAEIVVLDAGRGGGSLLTSNHSSWLIDTGAESLASSTVVPLLRERGINRLDGVILTHGDTMHIAGLSRVSAALPIARLIEAPSPNRSPAHREIRHRKDIPPVTAATTGTVEPFGSVGSIRILYPPADANLPLADDEAVVVRLDVGEFSALFLSDSGATAERWLLANARDALPCDVVVMGRHISGHSGSLEFLRTAAPRALVASAAAFPATELPRLRWTQAVQAAGIDLYRQDVTGAVTLKISDRSFSIIPFLKTPARTYPNDPRR